MRENMLSDVRNSQCVVMQKQKQYYSPAIESRKHYTFLNKAQSSSYAVNYTSQMRRHCNYRIGLGITTTQMTFTVTTPMQVSIIGGKLHFFSKHASQGNAGTPRYFTNTATAFSSSDSFHSNVAIFTPPCSPVINWMSTLLRC